MGQMSFQIPSASSYSPKFWETAYICGIEGIPWKCDAKLQNDTLTLSRSINESGKLFCVWPLEDHGTTVLSTASLRESEKPYLLPLEIARGTIFRVRSRAFDWQRLGLKIPSDFFETIGVALELFIDAIQRKKDMVDASRIANEATKYAVDAIRPLTRAFVSQSLQARHQQEDQLGTLMGLTLPTTADWRSVADQIRPAMNTVRVGLEWKAIESNSGGENYTFVDEQLDWANNEQLRIMAGPLVSLQPPSMPSWLYVLDDFESLLDAACKFVEKTVNRYKGRVHLWSAGAGLNTPNSLRLTDEQLLRMAVGVIETIRRADDRTPVILTLDMPFAEYLSHDENSVSPFHFADALIRAELGLSGLGLELNLGYWPNGTLPRDLIDLSDLIDRWAMLGLPLIANVTTPCSLANDPNAYDSSDIVSRWGHPDSNAAVSSNSPNQPTYDRKSLPPNGIDIFQLLLAKPNVHGVFWNGCRDAEAHVFSNSGLFDLNGQSRSLLQALKQLREMHVM